MSILSDIVKNTGKAIDKGVEDVLDEIERSPRVVEALAKRTGLLGRRGFAELDPSNLWRGPHKRGGGGAPKPIVPPEYSRSISDEWNEMLDLLMEGDASRCQAAGAKPWTITSTVVIGAGALAADTDLGTGSANPFSNTNSAFFTTAGVFPQPFLAYGIGGFISATQPAAATEVAAVLDSFYMSMRATTELARFSLTRDLGFDIGLQGNVAAAAATGAATVKASPYREWRQYFDPRTSYTWGARVPRAVTTVGAITYTQILHGVLFEGGALGREGRGSIRR